MEGSILGNGDFFQMNYTKELKWQLTIHGNINCMKKEGIQLFGRTPKKVTRLEYDKEQKTPIIKCSICNGEQIAGFKHLQTGKFEEIMLIRNEKDLEEFKERYGLAEVPKE